MHTDPVERKSSCERSKVTDQMGLPHETQQRIFNGKIAAGLKKRAGKLQLT